MNSDGQTQYYIDFQSSPYGIDSYSSYQTSNIFENHDIQIVTTNHMAQQVYLGVYTNYFDRASGYFEYTKLGWIFHFSQSILGNSGTRKIENDKIISRSLAYQFTGDFIKSKKYNYSFDLLYDLVQDLIGHYSNLCYRTHHNYRLYIKLKSRCRRSCNGSIISNQDWTAIQYLSHPTKNHINIEDISDFLYKCEINNVPYGKSEYKGFVKNKLNGAVFFKYKNNKINKYLRVKYLDFAVGYSDQFKQDEHCINFRIYLNSKFSFRIE